MKWDHGTDVKAFWALFTLTLILMAFVGGMLFGVHWYDTKYRPEIDRLLKDCHQQ